MTVIFKIKHLGAIEDIGFFRQLRREIRVIKM